MLWTSFSVGVGFVEQGASALSNTCLSLVYFCCWPLLACNPVVTTGQLTAMEELDARQIGQLFVMQYYTQMHKDPLQMFRFYMDNSTVVRGGPESGSADSVTGQKVRKAFACSVLR